MKKISHICLVLFILFIGSFAQDLKIINTNGDSEQFSIADIDSITFSLESDSVNEGHVVNASSSGPENLVIYTGSGIQQLNLEALSSMSFNANGSIAFFNSTDHVNQLDIADIDSMIFSDELDSTVYITFNDQSVTVTNPLTLLGVDVTVTNADVIVNSTSAIKNIKYVLSGTTTDGMFKIYSEEKLQLTLNNVQITNQDGPAINIQTGKKISVHLTDKTNNILTDGTTYSDAPDDEDQKAAFFSEGQLVFNGKGNLTINGLGDDEHGLGSDDYIEINDGSLIINSATKDGIHVNDGFFMNGGTVSVTSNGDGIDGGDATVEINDGTVDIQNKSDDTDAIKCDSTLIINGGAININVVGDQAKGLNSKQDVVISGGNLTITTLGDAVLEATGAGYDPSYCTAIKADGAVRIDSCSITIVTTGKAGRGISCDSDLDMGSGYLQITSSGNGNSYTNEDGEKDAYHGPCIKADGTLTMSGGEMILNHSGSAGKGISVDEQILFGTQTSIPVITITTTGDPVTISSSGPGGPGMNDGEAAEAKAISADGAITIENGIFTISSADDGIKSKEMITVNNGTININNSVEGIEAPNIFINDGTLEVKASDDALNATYGNGGEADDGSNMTINGGYVCTNVTNGDAFDSNGDFYVNGGTVIGHGPQSSPEVGVDVNGEFKVNGGVMIVSGTNSNMLQAPIQSSAQYSVMIKSGQKLNAGSLIHLEDADGNELVTFTPQRSYYSLIFSSSELGVGSGYKVYTGGNSNGQVRDGLYAGGQYSGGTLRKTFSITNKTTTVQF